MGRGRRRTANSEARLRKVVFDTQERPWIPGVDTESKRLETEIQLTRDKCAKSKHDETKIHKSRKVKQQG
jgi:hypothetical protein